MAGPLATILQQLVDDDTEREWEEDLVMQDYRDSLHLETRWADGSWKRLIRRPPPPLSRPVDEDFWARGLDVIDGVPSGSAGGQSNASSIRPLRRILE
jgi:hypothetical protein